MDMKSFAASMSSFLIHRRVSFMRCFAACVKRGAPNNTQEKPRMVQQENIIILRKWADKNDVDCWPHGISFGMRSQHWGSSNAGPLVYGIVLLVERLSVSSKPALPGSLRQSSRMHSATLRIIHVPRPSTAPDRTLRRGSALKHHRNVGKKRGWPR